MTDINIIRWLAQDAIERATICGDFVRTGAQWLELTSVRSSHDTIGSQSPLNVAQRKYVGAEELRRLDVVTNVLRRGFYA
jgi:hypothetical protein